MTPRLARPLVRLVHGRYVHDWHLLPRVSPSDSYLISFPRSGNTWLRCLVTSYLHGRAVTPELLQEAVPDVYVARQRGRDGIRSARGALLVKSHSPSVDIPAKVVYLVRDGRDAMLSYFYYLRRYEQERHPEDPIHRMDPRDFYLGTHGWIGSWHEHVLGWLDRLEPRLPASRLVLRYEDLVADTCAQLETVLRFVGLEPDAARVEHAVSLNTRASIARAEADAGEGALSFQSITDTTWASVLSPTDLAAYERLAGNALVKAGYPLLAAPVSGSAAADRQ